MPNPVSPDLLRAQALLRFDQRVADIDVIAQDLLRILAECIDRLKKELFEGFGYKAIGIGDREMALLTKATAAFNSATDAQIRLDKTAKERVKRMTHEEHKAAMADWLMRLPSKERAIWIGELVERHDGIKRQGRKLLPESSMAGVRAEAELELDEPRP